MLRIRPVTLAVCLLPLTLIACGDTPQTADDPRNQPPLVRVTQAQPVSETSRAFSGVVTARVQSDLGFRVAGKVLERLVDTGQTVKRGQPLLRLDPADLGLQARAQQETVTAAQARARQATGDEARYRDLVATGAVSATTYSQFKAAADAAKAELKAAEAQADVSRNAATYATLRQLSDSADSMTRTFEAKYVLSGSLSGAPLGSTVNIRIPTATATQQILQVPIAAVYDAGKGSGVWVIETPRQIVTWREVQVVGLSEDTARVTGNLSHDEQIVALGAHLLHEGQNVRVAAAGVGGVRP